MSISSYDGRCPTCYDHHEPHCNSNPAPETLHYWQSPKHIYSYCANCGKVIDFAQHNLSALREPCARVYTTPKPEPLNNNDLRVLGNLIERLPTSMRTKLGRFAWARLPEIKKQIDKILREAEHENI